MQPFMVRFMSDSFEVTGAAKKEAKTLDVGFRLQYVLESSKSCV